MIIAKLNSSKTRYRISPDSIVCVKEQHCWHPSVIFVYYIFYQWRCVRIFDETYSYDPNTIAWQKVKSQLGCIFCYNELAY